MPAITSKDIKRYDRSDMLSIIKSFHRQCAEAHDIGNAARLPQIQRRKFANVVCTGLGGSAIGADIARSYLAGHAALPIVVNRNYLLPAFTGPDTLVIASSYSGNTEETLSAYCDARSKGASIIAITSGGKLLKLARKDGNPCVVIPGGLPPRCALGYSFFPLLAVLSKAGICADMSPEAGLAIKSLDSFNAASEEACAIAGKLYKSFPVIYSCQDHIDSVAVRWRGQLAENSKTLSSHHVVPEMNHNEIVGWENPAKTLNSFTAVFLRDGADYERNALRMDITAKIISGAARDVIEVRSKGEGLLARIFSLVYVGDLVSYYLAILNKTDPTPVERITYLKKRLSEK
jgi:glucose/mannose-6-phosphate isomerase